MRKFIPAFILIVLFFASRNASAIDQKPEMLQQAMVAYGEERFEDALNLFEQLATAYPATWELLYNAGNSAYRLEKKGKAIVLYERALQIAPRDKDLRANRKLLTNLQEYKLEDKRNWYWRKWREVVNMATPHEIYTANASLYLLAALCWTIYFFFSKSFFFKLGRVFLILFILSLFPAGTSFWEGKYYQEAVVVSKDTALKYGPSKSEKVAVTLPEGITAAVKEDKGAWYQIQLKDGTTGWTLHKDWELI